MHAKTLLIFAMALALFAGSHVDASSKKKGKLTKGGSSEDIQILEGGSSDSFSGDSFTETKTPLFGGPSLLGESDEGIFQTLDPADKTKVIMTGIEYGDMKRALEEFIAIRYPEDPPVSKDSVEKLFPPTEFKFEENPVKKPKETPEEFELRKVCNEFARKVRQQPQKAQTELEKCNTLSVKKASTWLKDPASRNAYTVAMQQQDDLELARVLQLAKDNCTAFWSGILFGLHTGFSSESFGNPKLVGQPLGGKTSSGSLSRSSSGGPMPSMKSNNNNNNNNSPPRNNNNNSPPPNLNPTRLPEKKTREVKKSDKK